MNLTVVTISQCIHITLHILNLHNVINQLYLNKVGRGEGGKCYKIVKGKKHSHKQPDENIAEYLTNLRIPDESSCSASTF